MSKIIVLGSCFMKKLLGIIALGLLLSGNAYSHEDLTQNPPHKAHEPYKCKLDQDRTAMERFMCKAQAKNHRLCRLDQICILRKVEKLEAGASSTKLIHENYKLVLDNQQLREVLIYSEKEKKKLKKENKELKEKLDN